MNKKLLAELAVCLFLVACGKPEPATKSTSESEIVQKTETPKTIKLSNLQLFSGEKSPAVATTLFEKNSTVWLTYDVQGFTLIKETGKIGLRQDLVVINPSGQIILAMPAIIQYTDVISKKPKSFTNKINLGKNAASGKYTAIVNICDLYNLVSDRQEISFSVK